jgi:hypothetical protein
MDFDPQALMQQAAAVAQQAAEQVSAAHTREIGQQLDTMREQFLQFQQELLAQFNRGQQPQSRGDATGASLSAPGPATDNQPGTPTNPQVPAVPSSISAGKLKIASPEKFDGTRSKLEGFLLQVDLNFRSNPSAFGSDEQRIAFIASYLSGQALQWVTPLFSKADPITENYTTFREAFKKRFADPDEERKAERKLETMTQGKRSAAAYAAEFQLEASKTTWDDAAKKSRFRAGLRDDVLDLLVTIPATQLGTFQDFVDQAITCDDRLFERRQDRSRRLRDTTPPTTSSVYKNSTPSKPSLTSSSALSNSGYTGIAPMELGATRQVTEAERQRRRENNLCLYCGLPGHIIRQCPTRPKTSIDLPKPDHPRQQRANVTFAEPDSNSTTPNGPSPRETPRA